jgi:hypothetical protein
LTLPLWQTGVVRMLNEVLGDNEQPRGKTAGY